MSDLQTTVSPSFGDIGDVLPLTIQQDYGLFGDTDIHLLLLPAVGATLACSAGSVRYGNDKLIDVPGGIITFSGGGESSLPGEPATDPHLQVLFAFDTNGQPRGAGVQLHPNGKLKLDIIGTAAVAYGRYQTSAREIIYTPKLDIIGNGVLVTFGVIAAFYPPANITTYQTQPFNGDFGNQELELYRIFSYTVTTKDGIFEMPKGFPKVTKFPSGLQLDTSTAMQSERVHEIGYMDPNGRAWIRTQFVPIREPYIGDTSYKPVTAYQESPLPKDKYPIDLILRAKQFVASRGLGKP